MLDITKPMFHLEILFYLNTPHGSWQGNHNEKTFVTCWISDYSSIIFAGILSYFRIIF